MPSILDMLDREWADLARSDRACRRLKSWATRYPILQGLNDLDAVLARRRVASKAGPVLEGLASLAPDDDLAARTLLQALIPGIARLYGVVGRGDTSVLTGLVCDAWIRIRTYPPDRGGSVAANVLMDVRKWHWQERHAPAVWPVPPTAVAGTEPSAEDAALASVGIGDLVARVRRSVGDDTASVILRTRLGDTSLRDLSAELGVHEHVLTMRRSRAERRLRRTLSASEQVR